MSKYIIDTDHYPFVTDGIMAIGIYNGASKPPSTVYEPLENLEELNSDYINEHFGDLQDEAYQRGFEDGKAVNDKWCEGCMYQDNTIEHHPCGVCCNAYHNQWTAKDDKIEVGDEVERYINDKFDSKGIYLGNTDEEGNYWNCLFWTGATFITLAYPKDQFKCTGRHFDIAKILEDMKA